MIRGHKKNKRAYKKNKPVVKQSDHEVWKCLASLCVAASS